MKFGYWNTRGLGQVSRLLLTYTGQDFEQIQYSKGKKWFEDDKKNLGIDFPNLPYLIDGDFQITQSKAINSYIIMKSGKLDLLGKNIEDKARVIQLIGVFEDGITEFFKLFLDANYDKEKPLKILAIKLDYIDKFYGEKEWALGYITIFDFIVAQFSHCIEKLAPDSYNKYTFLKRLRQAFDSLPEIKKYYQRQTALKAPFLPKFLAVSF